MAYKRLGISQRPNDVLLGRIAQAEALVCAGRGAGRQRRLGRHADSAAPDVRCQERAARILTSGHSLTGALRNQLSSIVAQEVESSGGSMPREWASYHQSAAED